LSHTGPIVSSIVRGHGSDGAVAVAVGGTVVVAASAVILRCEPLL
jgi:hypothetical protein